MKPFLVYFLKSFNFAKQTYQFALVWWQRSFKERALRNYQLSDHVKAFKKGKLQGCRNSQNHTSFIIPMRGKLQRLQHRDWSNLCLAEKIILWEEFGGDVFMSALTLRKTFLSFLLSFLSFFLWTSPFGLPIQQRKIICFGCAPCTSKNEVIWNLYKQASFS